MKEKTPTVQEIVNNFPTKYPQGLTSDERTSLLEKHFPTISIEQFNEKLGVNTVLLVNNEVVVFPSDIELAIHLCLENREATLYEFD